MKMNHIVNISFVLALLFVFFTSKTICHASTSSLEAVVIQDAPCVPVTVNLHDTYGDGWNGNYLYFTPDISITMGCDVCTDRVMVVCLLPGVYSPYACGGEFPEEVVWEIDGYGISGGAHPSCTPSAGSFTVQLSSTPSLAPSSSPSATYHPTALPTIWYSLVNPNTLEGTVVLVTSTTDAAANASQCTPLSPQSLNNCTLRSAVELCARSLSTDMCSVVLPDAANMEMAPSLGEIVVMSTTGIAIYGQGSVLTAATRTHRFMRVDSSSNISVFDLELYGFGGGSGAESAGGAMLLSGARDVLLERVRFRLNRGGDGGAVFVNTSKSVTFAHCVFRENRAAGSGGAMFVGQDNRHIVVRGSSFKINAAAMSGGGVYVFRNNDFVTVDNSLMLDNYAGDRGGGVYIDIYNDNFKLHNSSVTLCSAKVQGGGVYVYQHNNGMQLTSVTLKSCSASTEHGGGVFVHSFNVDFLLEQSRLVHCSAGARGGGLYSLSNNALSVVHTSVSHCVARHGGGLYFDSNSVNVLVFGCEISDCSAGDDGGALVFSVNNDLVVVEDSEISRCRAGDLGGGVYLDSGNDRVTVRNVLITDCSSVDNGGAIYLASSNVNFLVEECVISRCSTDGNGGGLFAQSGNKDMLITNTVISGCAAQVDGGGMFLSSSNTNFHLQSSQLDGNSAEDNGGSIYLLSDNTYATVENCSITDGRAVLGGGICLVTRNHYFRVIDSRASGCTASNSGGFMFVYSTNDYVALRGGVVSGCSAINGNGGGISVESKNNFLEVSDSVLHACSCAGRGGGLSLSQENTRVSVTNTLFTQCTSKFYAGGMSAEYKNHDLTVQNVTFDRCGSSSNGGGIRIGSTHERLIVRDSSFVKCSSSNGGGIYIFRSNKNTLLQGCEFTECVASGGGGAIRFWDFNTDTTIVDVYIEGCTANAGAGMAFEENNVGLSIINSSVINCEANYGTGLHFDKSNSNILLDRMNVSRCRAVSGNGGGLYLEGTGGGNERVRIVDSSFVGNSARGFGGAIAADRSNRFLTIAGCTIAQNSAGESGGGIYLLEDHKNFVMIDTAGAEASEVLQSPHPYESFSPSGGQPQIIFSATVTVPGAAYFLVNFDELSNVYFNDKFYIYDNAVDRNVLFSTGDNIYPGVKVPTIELPAPSIYVEFRGPSDTAFAPTSLASNTYGIKLYVTPVMAAPDISTLTVLRGNTAGNRGGGMHLIFSNTCPVLVHTKFESNRASFGGGAVYMTNANKGAVYHQVAFTSNVAGSDGGAIYYSMSHFGHQFRDCSFTSNSAVGDGGGVLMSTANGDGTFDSGNPVHFRQCLFRENSAASGGAISVTINNFLVFTGCELVGNAALSAGGGAIVAHQQNSITVEKSLLLGNSANTFGGGIDTVLQNIVRLVDVNVTGNFVKGCGGGVAIRGSSSVAFAGDSVLASNRASAVGGGIAVMSSSLWQLEPGRVLLLERNGAPRGSALFFTDLHTASPGGGASEEMHDVEMTGNTASIGGTVFWLSDTTMTQEPPGVNSSTVRFKSNAALYGERVATQAVELMAPREYMVEAYATALDPPLALHMVDVYGQVVMIDGFTSVVVSVLDAQVDKCNSLRPFVAGENTIGAGVPFVHGIANFSHLLVQCYPKGSLVLQFEAKLGNLANLPEQVAAEYYIKNFSTLHFRQCFAGEVYVNGLCAPCPRGTFSLEKDVTESTECLSCTADEGVEACWADQIVLTEGYWRRFSWTQAVLECPLEQACSGGGSAGELLCAEGYEGAMCAVCMENFFSDQGACKRCTDQHMITTAMMVYICVALVVIGCLIAVLYFKYLHGESIEERMTEIAKRRSSSVSSERDSVVLQSLSVSCLKPKEASWREEEDSDSDSDKRPVTPPTRLELLALWLHERYPRLMIKLKIIVVTLQVVSSVPASLDVTMPSSFTNFVNSFNFLGLSLSAAFPISCSGRFTFIDQLVLTTLAPLVIVLILVIAFFLEYAYHRHKIQQNRSRRKGEKASKFNEVKERYSNYVFYLTYLIMPSVTTTIFATFICTSIDPEDEEGGDYLYLVADMSISCHSDYYHRGVMYACLMIVVYPVGITAMYAVVLYRNRMEIMQRETSSARGRATSISAAAGGAADAGAGEEKELSRGAVQIMFLWQSYTPQYWYWEVVETVRRLILTAVVSVCAPGTPSQAVFALLIALLYIKVYGYYAPYAHRQDSVLAETGQFQVFLTFFIALIIQNSLLPDAWTAPLGVLLIILNLSVLYYTMMVEMKNIIANDNKGTDEANSPPKSGFVDVNWDGDVANGDVEMKKRSAGTDGTKRVTTVNILASLRHRDRDSDDDDSDDD